MKSLSLCAALMFCAAGFHAQTESSAFTNTGRGVATPFATDYHCLGINPANLDIPIPYEGKSMTFGVFELGASFYSEAFSKLEVRQNMFGEKIGKLSFQDQKDLAAEFANSVNSGDIDIMTFGMAAQTGTFGSFGFSVRERIDFYSKIGDQLSEIIWLGYAAPYFENLVLFGGDTIPNTGDLSEETLNQVIQGYTPLENAQSISQLVEGTELRFSWLREFNLGWGKKLLSRDTWELYGGVGAKVLIGQGLMQLTSGGDGAAEAFTSMSPIFDIDYGDTGEENPTSLPSDAPSLAPVGFGFGLDLGATLLIKQKFTISAAITDIGQVTWDGNVYKLKDFQLTTFDNEGLESVDFIDQVTSLNGGDGVLEWEGDKELKTRLGTNARVGAGLNINERFKIGVDVIAPLNDNGLGQYDNAVIAFGGEVAPVRWLKLQAGFVNGGNYDFKIPVGLVISVANGTYEMGMASRDMVTFFSEQHPTVSASMGFLRFRF
ncbi:MAG: hypothetical protein RL220_1408 [Bacteroidota bacterium]